MTPYPKRLIEVDLPIKRISAHARREKSIRHGHISTLHIWWARRPLAACRAVICAALWPDPADELCPPAFREAATREILAFARKAMTTRSLADGCSPESMGRWNAYAKVDYRLDTANPDHLNNLRHALLDFIADFANWDNSTNPHFLATSRALTQAAHEALGGQPGTRPLVVDPFAGGGAIPLEALRVGADAFASDLNPVAVLLNKVVLEYIPKYGKADLRMKNAEGEEVTFHGLAAAVRYWGNWIKEQAEKELAQFYPKDPDGATPIAYLWARTIISEAPGDNTGIPVEVPLMSTFWLAKPKGRNKALRWVRDAQGWVQTEIVEVTYADGVTRRVRRPILEIFEPKTESDVEDGTVGRGSATCPVTGYTTPLESVRRQLKSRRGGADDARLFTVVTTRPDVSGRSYRLPSVYDLRAVREVNTVHKSLSTEGLDETPLFPGELVDKYHHDVNRLPMYGMTRWGDAFTHRQATSLVAIASNIRRKLFKKEIDVYLGVILALAFDRLADYNSSVCRWVARGEYLGNTFGRQAIQMVWDFAEVNPMSGSTGDWAGAIEWISKVIERESTSHLGVAFVSASNAADHPLPDDTADAFVTDPPYFDAIDYAVISDYFYVWLKRILVNGLSDFLSGELTPKDTQIVVNSTTTKGHGTRDEAFFRNSMMKAMYHGRRVTKDGGIGVVVFAHKSTAGWESQLLGMLGAGWTITGSWPIDTEMGERLRARDSAALASSIHLVCRPRTTNMVGDWREVLQELPGRIHAWLPRLAREGIVGADAIFACLGPALEIFSRYSRVERASGEVMTLGQYLEYVWAAVSKEALDMVFQGADTAGFEEDARLTAMWLWTLASGQATDQTSDFSEKSEVSADKPAAGSGYAGFALEYDAARKIAQGLGAHLEQLGHLVQIKGSEARLLPVPERARHLFGVEGVQQPARRARDVQPSLFGQLSPEEAEAAGWQMAEDLAASPGATVLDRVHQAMLLFAAGRSDSLKRFLQEGGVGGDDRFWRLAQALSALYPTAAGEKRWVDGVLARKKGLGF